uniref:TATA element modulatory factor 1 TATA binding domain-containing protein n=1 Tax=Anopheles arabiensis TaxID=7173 RepID=A0A182I9Y3_ANOAR
MSWFDTTGIANLAKNALKEAQKQIDKALDIKDEEETTIVSVSSVGVETSGGEKLVNSSMHSVVSIHPTAERTNVLQPSSVDLDADGGEGTSLEQSTAKSSNAIKTPSNLRHASVKAAEKRNDSTSSTTEADSSSAAVPIITSPSQPSPLASNVQDGKGAESVELIDTTRTSTSSSTESPVIVDHSTRFDAHQGQQYTGVKEHPDRNEEYVSVESDTVSYILSEQPNTVPETCVNSPPITVAPGRSSYRFSIPTDPSMNVVGVASPTIETLSEKCEEPQSKESFDKDPNNRAGDPVQQVSKELSDALPSQRFLTSKQELENSYENLEFQAQLTDLTHSFEDLKSCGSAAGSHFPSTASSEQFETTDKLSDAAFETLGGLGAGQNLFQSLGEDEIETTTSSDIEIISSPNGGDSSSTNSGIYRTSPLKMSTAKGENFDMMLIKRRRGHTREPSEISINSGNSDDSSHLPETEQLMRRLEEVSETLEQREYRLVELGRQNAELNEQNAQLTAQLESKAKREGGSDLDGYMQRLSALERKFQQSIREKENLKSKFDALRMEADKKVAKCDMDKAVSERDFMINELQKEGESLSKQVLQHSNIIKKLRAKEKESSALISKQCDEISELTQETERLKRSLSAKEEVERSQIDAVHKLTSEKGKLERERAMLDDKLNDQIQKSEAMRKSLEFVRNELNEKSELCHDLQKRLDKLQNCKTDSQTFQKTNEVLMLQLEDLREQLRRTEQDYGQRLNRAKNEHAEVLRKLEAAELRTEEEKNASALLTMPLMKQLDSLQNLLRHKERLGEQRDASFAQQLSEALERIKLISDKEKTQRDIIITMQNRITNLEERLQAALLQTKEAVARLKQQTLEAERRLEDCNKHEGKEESLEKKAAPTIEHAHENEAQLDGADKIPPTKQTATIEANESDPNIDSSIQQFGMDMHPVEASSVTSIGNLSLPDSLNSIPWTTPEDDAVSLGKVEPFNDGIVDVGYNLPNLFNTTSHLETLQATLKQRDGEICQLQWEVSRFQQERNVLSAEISNLTIELDNVRERFECSIRLEEEHTELQNRYDALLQMYGEAVEKTEELQLDLADVKDMYKIQIDDLLQRQRELIASMSHQSSLLSSSRNNC